MLQIWQTQFSASIFTVVCTYSGKKRDRKEAGKERGKRKNMTDLQEKTPQSKLTGAANIQPNPIT
jgi:hypothetical protein